MGDSKVLDTNQIVNGLALLLSFFVGYKCALSRHLVKEDLQDKKAGKQFCKRTIEQQEQIQSGDTAEKVYASLSFRYKMVLIVRNDLKMGKGKVAAQCGHAAVGAYQKAVRRMPCAIEAWENTGSAKIALKVESEAELMAIKNAAEASKLNWCLIRDAGLTQIEPNTKTVLAIGPAPAEDLDPITGNLKLL